MNCIRFIVPGKWLTLITTFTLIASHAALFGQNQKSWIRINQLGYSKEFQLIEIKTGKTVFKSKIGKDFGAYGPFTNTWRLNFSDYRKNGEFYLSCGEAKSPVFKITNDAYKGAADFVLRYMRQQRSGYNPFLKDSCHTRDGFTIYGPMPDGTYVDVSGGWHDATDYLQYATTSANATYHLLAAYCDFANVFSDAHLANGLKGKNQRADVLDEADWGLKWLLKMHPREDWMFNQIADDRDHAGFRLPTIDSVDYGYGKGKGRPVYFISGTVQGLGKHQNRATGAASTAGKFASAFALGSEIFQSIDADYASLLRDKSISAFNFGTAKPGVAQTSMKKTIGLMTWNWEPQHFISLLATGSISNLRFNLVAKRKSLHG
jgi:endoglucanase